MVRLFEHERWLRLGLDFLDVFLVAFLIYSILRLIRGTRSINMLIGLGIFIFTFWISSVAELYTLNWVLHHFLGNLLIIIVLLFQNEIRRFLARVGQTPFFSLLNETQDSKTIDEIVRACISLSNKKIGALIVMEKEAGLSDYLELGVNVDGAVSKELLTTIFLPASPIHDGAVIIQKGRVAYASCFLPLSMNQDLDSDLGTRHRAAVGISEETDALVITVSEEKGWISVAQNGKILRGIDGVALRKLLNDQFNSKISILPGSDNQEAKDEIV
jgi:diadenylate cyclase